MQRGLVVFETSAGSIELEGYSSWRNPIKNTGIYLHPELMQSLSLQALRSLNMSPSSEIGGLLWGRISNTPIDPYVVIELAEFIEADAPLYNTTPADAYHLSRAVTRSKSENSLSLVGYFRSHVREGLCLSDEDQELIQHYMPDPMSVFLVIRPFEIGVCIAGFFFWDGNCLQTDASDLEVPFGPSSEIVGQETVNHDHSGVGCSRGPSAAMEPRVEPVRPGGLADEALSNGPCPREERALMEAPASPVCDRRSIMFLPYVAAALGIVAGSAAYLSLPTLRSLVQALPNYTRNGQVELHVTRATDGQLRLDWNGHAPQWAAAHNAKLTIVDGSINRELNLNSSQLQSGRLNYFPSGNDVQFRLEVYLDETRSVAESLRVLLPVPETNVIEANLAPTRIQAPGVETPRQDRLIPQTRHLSMPRRPDQFKPAPYGELEQPKTFVVRDREFSAPDVPFHIEQPDVDVLSSASLPLPVPKPFGGLALPAVNRAKPVVVLGSPPDSERSSSPIYVQPRPLRRITPDIHHLPANIILQPEEVTVEVRLDPTGLVVAAHLIKNDNVNLFLTTAAIAAAKRWIFEPATLGGKPVAANHTIVFQFSRDN